MGRTQLCSWIAGAAVLCVLTLPGAFAAPDPIEPPQVPGAPDGPDVPPGGPGLPDAPALPEPDEAGDDAQDQADSAAGQAEEEASNVQEEVSDAKHGLLDSAKDTANEGNALIGSLGTVAGQTVDAIREMAQRLVQRLTDSNSGAEREFESPSSGAGSAHVSSSSVVSGLGADEAALAMAVAAAGAGGALFYYVVLQRLVLFGIVPLLSRIAHSEIYTNDARRTIAELVQSEPGACLNDLVGRTGYSRNAVSYHLFVLEKEEELISIKDGKYRRYFARNGKYVNGAKNVVSALRNETTKKMAQFIVARPGSIQRELCVALGTTASAACWHAKRLEDLHVIRKERAANTVRYFPGEALGKYDLSEFGLTGPPAAMTAPIETPAPSAPGGLPNAVPTA